MIRFSVGFGEPVILSLSEFLTWFRKFYKNVIVNSGYLLDMQIFIRANFDPPIDPDMDENV